jgi:CubicO group peptidase (beta-lactamase class C family)
MSLRSLSAFGAIPILLASCAAHAPALHPEDVDRIDAVAKDELARGRHVGFVVGVLKDGARAVRGYGRLAADRPEAPDGRTVFEIGSITKAFTGILLADAAVEGRVALDDPVRRHLPEGWKIPVREGREITLAHLATHTSGFPRLPANLAFKDPSNPYASYSETDLSSFLGSYMLRREPGDRYEYSNLGAGLLGRALSGGDYEKLVLARIASPLGLEDTRIALTEDQKRRLGPPHAVVGKPAANWDLPTLAGAGALRSTADDLLRFLEANLGAGPGTALALSHEERFRAGPQGPRIGLGWHLTPLLSNGKIMIWHNGGTGGYRSFAGFVKETRTAVVVLANTAADVDGLAVALLELLNR